MLLPGRVDEEVGQEARVAHVDRAGESGDIAVELRDRDPRPGEQVLDVRPARDVGPVDRLVVRGQDRGDRRDVGRDGRPDRGHPDGRAGRP